jgi:hypothetical protein
LETPFSKRTYGIATAEYLKFIEKSAFQYVTNFTAVPIQIGIKYYTAKEVEKIANGLFISGEIGIIASTSKYNYTSGNQNKFKESGISVAPGIGYQFSKIESSIRPQFNLSASGFNVYYLNFRLGYKVFQ